MVGGQVLIIYVGGKAFNVVRLNGAQWGYSLVLGFLSIPVGMMLRMIPDELIVRLIPQSLKNRSKRGPELTLSDEEQQFRFPQPLTDVKEELGFIKRMKGGRINNLKFAMQHPRETFLPRSRSGSRSRSNSFPPQTPSNEFPREDTYGSPAPTPESRKRGKSTRSRSNSALGATAVMAGIIAGSVAGWSPIERGHGDDEILGFSRARGRSELESREGVEVHPATRADDTIITEEPHHLDNPPSQIDEITPSPAVVSPPPSTTTRTRRSSNLREAHVVDSP